MSWEKEEAGVRFFCDNAECTAELYIAASFADASVRAHEKGWHSFKRPGRPWTYFCPACALAAKRAHEAMKQHDEERERERDRRREQG